MNMLITILFFTTWWLTAWSQVWTRTETQFVDLLTAGRGYDKYKPPEVNTLLRVGLHLNSIIAVDEQKQQLEVDLYLRLFWFDPRLTYDPGDHEGAVILQDSLASRIWRPDLYFENAREVAMETRPVEHRLIKFYSSGRVWMATRYRLTLACAMDFHRFPFDQQQCSITMQDYSHTSAETGLIWFNDTDPFTISSGALETPQFRLVNSQLDNCERLNPSRTHPCLNVDLELRRSPGYAVRQCYLPIMLLLVANYFSVLLGRNISHVRFGYLLIIMALMCTTALTCSLTMNVPRVSYFTLYDYWMAVSFMFYFLTVLHFALVMMVKHRTASPDYLCMNKGKLLLAEEEGEVCTSVGDHHHAPPVDKPNARLARYLDLLAIVFYPLLLLVFVVTYGVCAL